VTKSKNIFFGFNHLLVEIFIFLTKKWKNEKFSIGMPNKKQKKKKKPKKKHVVGSSYKIRGIQMFTGVCKDVSQIIDSYSIPEYPFYYNDKKEVCMTIPTMEVFSWRFYQYWHGFFPKYYTIIIRFKWKDKSFDYGYNPGKNDWILYKMSTIDYTDRYQRELIHDHEGNKSILTITDYECCLDTRYTINYQNNIPIHAHGIESERDKRGKIQEFGWDENLDKVLDMAGDWNDHMPTDSDVKQTIDYLISIKKYK
jgi:hypothetical protein